MRGNAIIVSSNPKGQYDEGTIGEANRSPGTIMQLKAATPFQGGRPVWVAAASGTDGKDVLYAVLLEDDQQGVTATGAGAVYAINTHCRLYFPIKGEEMNILAGEVAGTGNSFAIGDRLIVDAEDGILIPETGTPQATFAVSMQALPQVAGSTLLWVKII